jgi:hypothetical protein
MKRHMFAMIAVGLGFSALVSLGGCSAATEEDGEAQSGEEALSRTECTTKAGTAKTKHVSACATPRDAAKATAKTCTAASEKTFADFQAKLKAAAPADSAVQSAVAKCLESSACEARQTIAKLTGKAVSEVESPGFSCTVAEWWNSIFSTCGSIDATDIGSAEYKSLVKQIPAKKTELTTGLRRCNDALDSAVAAYNECTTDRAEAVYSGVYAACRAECKVERGKACAPEGESVACGVSGDKREGLLWADKGCICRPTSVCDSYHSLEAQLKVQSEQQGVRCDLANPAGGTPLAGVFRPQITLDSSGAPNGVTRVCAARK